MHGLPRKVGNDVQLFYLDFLLAQHSNDRKGFAFGVGGSLASIALIISDYVDQDGFYTMLFQE